MTIQRMDHVGIVVDDLADAIEFFVELAISHSPLWTSTPSLLLAIPRSGTRRHGGAL